MTINQLKYVLAVYQSSSMREAAGKLYVTQPALSASIRELEEEIGVVIFDRTNKGITTTKQGEEFIEYAKRAINQFELLEDRYVDSDKEKVYFSVSSQHYSFAINAFSNVVKKIDNNKYVYSFHETKTKDVLENVRDMKSEVGIISFTANNEKIIKKLLKEYNLEFEFLMERENYADVWKTHKLASKKSISIKELQDYPCITFEQKNDADFYLNEEALSDYKFDKLIKSEDRATSMELIALLDGYSIGSGMLAEKGEILEGLVSIKLEEEDPIRIGYIKRKGIELSEMGQEYVEELSKYKDEDQN